MGINNNKKEKARDGYLKDLPEDLQSKVMNVNKIVVDAVNALLNDPAYTDLKSSSWAMTCIEDFKKAPSANDDIGSVRIFKKGNKYECMIQCTGHFTNHQYGWIEELLHDFIRDVHQMSRIKVRKKYDMRLDDEGAHGNSFEGFDVYPSNKIAKEMWDKFEDRKTRVLTESEELFTKELFDENDNITESTDSKPLPDYNKEYNTDMTEKQAKNTLRTLSQTIINGTGEDGKVNKKVSQYTANIYANIITKNLLPKWAPSFKKFSITLDSYQSFFTFEFKVPTISQDFISRFIEGREPINAFLHRVPEIKVKMSPRIFHTMKDPDDAFNFFKAAIKYYDSKVEKYSNNLMNEIFKLNTNMKHLISTTKLSGLVIYPLQLLFVFDDVHMNNKDTFELSKEDINAVNQFVRNIYNSYAAPEKEKKKIVEDMKTLVKELHEACDDSDNIRELSYLPEAVESYLFGKFDEELTRCRLSWMNEQVDFKAMRECKDNKVTALYEKFGVKKLKKIPADLVAYITIETESIKDANDKMMIASYCCSKIEIVEWYIELLEVGSKKYVVPHTKPYLENLRTQLLACYKKIMATPIPKQDRAIINVQYPSGYEG